MFPPLSCAGDEDEEEFTEVVEEFMETGMMFEEVKNGGIL